MDKIKKLALFAEGAKDIFQAKTVSLLLRYRANDVLCIIDPSHNELNPNFFHKESSLSIIKSISEAKEKPDAMVIALVLPEARVPLSWQNEIIKCIEAGIDVINPLHINFSSIEHISNSLGGISQASSPETTVFKKGLGKIHNIRIVPEDLRLLSLDVLNTKAKRVLTVGTDCNIGKMLTALELNKKFIDNGINSGFIATGQNGILVKGEGVAIDRAISDFVPGAVETMILKERDRDILFIEGQGSLFQPIYSAVTMGLMHGSAPNGMILCHAPTRKKLRYTNIEIPSIKKAITIYEDMANLVCKSKVFGISLNCHDLNEQETKDAIARTEDLSGLPTTDPVKLGVEKLFKAIKVELFQL